MKYSCKYSSKKGSLMEKKIRVTLPDYIYSVMTDDIDEFSINKNRMCNYIYRELKFKSLPPVIPTSQEKKTLQFNLNKVNLENYYQVLEENHIQVEAEFFRKVFYKYTNQPKRSREAFIFKNELEKIKYAIEEKRALKITFRDGKTTKITPYYVGSSKLELSNYIFSYDHSESEYKNYKLCHIKSVFITREAPHKGDPAFIQGVISNFDPFLSRGKSVVVHLTKRGAKLLAQLKTNRPELIKQEGDLYHFECSSEKAKRYFSYFLSEVRIIEPQSLAQWFKEEFFKAYKNYD